MKKLMVILFLVVMVVGVTPVKAEKLDFDYDDTIKVNEEYESWMSTCDEDVVYKIKISKPGWYKVMVTLDEVYDEDGYKISTSEDCLSYTLYNGCEEVECDSYFGETNSDIIGFEKDNAYIQISDFGSDIDGEIEYSIKVVNYTKRKTPFSKVSKLLKANKSSYAVYKASKTKASLYINGVKDIDDHDEEGYTLGFNARPVIQVVKQNKTSYMTFYFEGLFLCYSIPPTDDSDLNSFIIGNKKTKVTYDLDYSKEKNWFSYKDYFYKDECRWKCTVFNSYTVTNNEVDKLIKIINGNGSYIKIKGADGAYYKIKLTKANKKEWVNSLNIYKKVLKKY